MNAKRRTVYVATWQGTHLGEGTPGRDGRQFLSRYNNPTYYSTIGEAAAALVQYASECGSSVNASGMATHGGIQRVVLEAPVAERIVSREDL